MFELKTLTDYSDESLLAEIRRVATEFKGKRLTRQEFNELSRVHSSTLEKRFGSYADALAKAGIEAEIAPPRLKRVTREELIEAIKAYAAESGETPRLDDVAGRLDVNRSTILSRFGSWPILLKEVGLQSVPLGRRYTDEECYENIVELWTHYGRQPKFHELNSALSRVGSKAYVLRWGGWRAALGAFVSYINQSPRTFEGDPSVTLVESKEEADEARGATITTEPRSLGLALRYKVLCRDRFCCQICGRSPAKDFGVELHVDHILPWSKGGLNTEDNLRVLCFDCNLGKGAKYENVQ